MIYDRSLRPSSVLFRRVGLPKLQRTKLTVTLFNSLFVHNLVVYYQPLLHRTWKHATPKSDKKLSFFHLAVKQGSEQFHAVIRLGLN